VTLQHKSELLFGNLLKRYFGLGITRPNEDCEQDGQLLHGLDRHAARIEIGERPDGAGRSLKLVD
jgi:hypothetical protein